MTKRTSEAELAQIKADQQLLSDLLKNPIIELVGGFVLVETLQRYPKSRPIIGNVQGNLIEGGIAAIIMAQQLAPSLPYLVQGTSDMTKLLPSIAGMAAAL
jgi:hypothetical protein